MSHANIICKRCGATAHSKCPICRSVFMDCEAEALISRSQKFKVIRDYDRGGTWLQVEILVHGEKGDDDYAIAVKGHKELLTRLKGMEETPTLPPEEINRFTYPTIEQWCCNHQWEFLPGQQSSIGCGHGYKE